MIALPGRLRRFFAPQKNTARKSIYSSFTQSALRSYMVMPGQPVWMDRRYEQFANEAYVRNVVAHRAIGMVASSAASVWFKLYATGNRGGRKEIKTHPALGLLMRPNPMQSHGEFFQALYHYLLIGGNAYVQSAAPAGGRPTELHLLRPDRITVIAGKGTLPAAYRYTVGDKSRDFPVDAITGASRILHLKNFHPLNDWYGLSPIEAASYSIDQHNQAGAWNQALLQNGARPSGALVVKPDVGGGVLSEDQYHRIKNQVDEQFSGAMNAGRPLLLEGGLDWKELSLSPKDMDFVETKHSAARDIALALGVPPQMLGIPGDNTYSNLQEARLALWEQTVLPLAERTADSFTRWLLAMFDNQLEFAPDTDNLHALAPRNQIIWDRVERASFLTDDEKRAAVGYGPMPVEPQAAPPFNPPENLIPGMIPIPGDLPVKYSPSQPRDDHGRWTDGGGSSGGRRE
jgi:HK97 family phage portal protein